VKIVVVEDEISSRNGLVNMIPKLDPSYEVVGMAADGKEGLEVVSQVRPDLIIMDIEMPEMDGLAMLERLREKRVLCKVLVLTAYSDFSYAKKAIELGIENYLLKPIKIPELKRSLETIARELDQEKGQLQLQERLFSLEQILRGCMMAELPVDEGLNRITKAKYGLDVKEPLALFTVWLGAEYQSSATKVQKLLEECTRRAGDYRSVVLVSTKYELVQVLFYQLRDPEAVQQRYSTGVIQMVCRDLKKVPVFTWVECEGLAGLPDGLAQVQKLQLWNLSFPEGTLISRRLLDNTHFVPLKYPLALETELRQAVMRRSPELLEQTSQKFMRYCRIKFHKPEEIHSACVRLGIYLTSLLKTMGIMRDTELSQMLIARVASAGDWEEIQEIFGQCARLLEEDHGENRGISPLVRQARQMIEEYYSQGITLEEIATKLHVSEEYLSVQFKRETGASFTETIRGVRMKRIKELLLHSNLKLNQIADMVGYSDAKYMSKVFREETGMLPAEFRKLNA